MEPIQAARELGKAIQADERFKAYFAAKDKNDSDEALQNLIGEFNLQRENLSRELSKGEEKEQSKVENLNIKMRETYELIMNNENMQEYTRAKGEVDLMINQVNQIIAMCCEGENPDTCEPKDCAGSCSSCAGCN
ncbi:MAG: YlbF family regulator [Oscillospiraceae bacterium]|nr:YlbF family regulator [Oscillospiraceae bacterium]